jgi:predicted O-methyltransferase YrrM
MNLRSKIKRVVSRINPPPALHPTLVHAPPGHFYSPLPEPSEFRDPENPVFDTSLRELPGIDLNSNGQFRMLDTLLPHFREFASYTEAKGSTGGPRFNFNQYYFMEADALVLFAILSHCKPRRIIEVGSGHSSALMLDTVDGTDGWNPKITFIDPYPERLQSVLQERDQASTRIIKKRVQDVPVEEFLALDEGDLLFIDSSHVSKIGSDVNFLFFDVLPRLKPGVIIHIHDVFWPFEYPREWILEGRSWNEDYLLRALLTGSDMFQIMFWNSWMGLAARQQLEKDCPMYLRDTGGSIYLRKVS